MSTESTESTASPTTTAAGGPPFHADHVGSFLRPAAVKAAREAHAAGGLDATALRAVEDEAVREIVRRQREAGLASATDGEVRRASWQDDFILGLRGIEVGGEREMTFTRPDGTPVAHTASGLAATGALGLDETVFGADLAFLQGCVADGVVAKLTIPSPNQIHNVFAPLDVSRAGDTYAGADVGGSEGDERLRADIAAAYREQLRRVREAGLTYLQIDDCRLPFLGDARYRDTVPTALASLIGLFNAALAGRPAGMSVATHLCRGNFRSSWRISGGYEAFADELFNTLDVDGYFLEFDDERSGSLDVLRFLPPGKRVVLGLVTTKRAQLEDADSIKRRLDVAARYAPLEQLALSGQCGFSSTQEGNDLTDAQQWAKLRHVVGIAQDVWG